MGNEGTIEVLNRQVLNFYPEKFSGKAPEKVAARKEMTISPGPTNDHKAVEAHIGNFLDAVRGKGQVIAPPAGDPPAARSRSEETTSELHAHLKLICRHLS